jgi:hypothetical protein
VVSSLLLWFCFVAAQPSGVVPLDHAGQTGVWLPLDSARRLLEIEDQHQGCDLRARRCALFAELLEVRKHEIDLFKLQVVNEQTISANLRVQLAEADRLRVAAETASTRWYRNPYILTAAGLVTGTLAVLIATR